VKLACFWKLIFIFTLVCLPGCGGGGSASSSNGSGNYGSSGTVSSVLVSPSTAQLRTGDTQQFTAHASGTGTFSPSVTWSVSGVNGGNATVGTINNGLYTAPAAVPSSNPVTIAATSTVAPSIYNSATVTIYEPPVLTSITPSSASAGESITVDVQNGATQVIFSGPNGTALPAIFLPSPTVPDEGVAVVPFGAVSGPLYVQTTAIPGGGGPTLTSNTVQFTRFPNLKIHAPINDLSSGETLQFSSDLLGTSSPSQLTWTANAGTISPSGLYQAPVVTTEISDYVTGCVQGTRSCDAILLRIVPLRLVPDNPIVTLGNSIQMDANVGGALQAAQWSVLAGGGTITGNGLYTAPTSGSGAGPVALSVTANVASQQTRLSVTGAFPGLVNRIYNYVDFHTLNAQTLGPSFSWAVTGAANRAFALDLGTGSEGPPFRYSAIDVYDTTTPHQPSFVKAVESVVTKPTHFFTYGNHLFEVDSGYLAPVPSRIVSYAIQGGQPVLSAITNLPDLAFTTVNNGKVYGLPTSTPSSFSLTSFPIYVFDVSNGFPTTQQYVLPVPAGNSPLQFLNISGIGNTIYVSWLGTSPFSAMMLSTYDISTSPPTMVSTVPTQFGFHIQVVNSNLLFADAQIYDISNGTPVPLVVFPMFGVSSVQGNSVVAQGFFSNYYLIDVANPSNPVIVRNVADQPAGYILQNNPSTALVGNTLLTTDGLGGIAVYDVSASGGPEHYNVASSGTLVISFDRVLKQSLLYVAGETVTKGGGLDIFDLSGAIPTEVGSISYPPNNPNALTPTPNPAFALQVSGTNVFLGLADSLRTIDLSSPSAPIETGAVQLPTNALALSGNTLFVGTGDSRLVVLNVSNASALQQLASVPLPGPPNTLRISGSLLFVSDVDQGLLIFNVSNPVAPVLLSQTLPGNPVWDTAISGSTAVVAADASGLLVLDVSNPAIVKQLSQTSLPVIDPFPPYASFSPAVFDQAFSISIQNGLAYIGTLSGFLEAYDFSTPANPRLVSYNGTGFSPGVDALGSNLYLTQGLAVQLDNSAPFNSIQLLYPPTLFTNAFPDSSVGANRISALANNPKSALARQLLKWSPGTAQPPAASCSAASRQIADSWQKFTSATGCHSQKN
jgi:hypothetical protein